MLTIRGGYHGDTFAAMSVCDPERGMHSEFTGVLDRLRCSPQRPPAGFGRPATDADVCLGRSRCESSRMRHAMSWLRSSLNPCCRVPVACTSTAQSACAFCARWPTSSSLLLILDEIATGFGRTGAMFAADHAASRPTSCASERRSPVVT